MPTKKYLSTRPGMTILIKPTYQKEVEGKRILVKGQKIVVSPEGIIETDDPKVIKVLDTKIDGKTFWEVKATEEEEEKKVIEKKAKVKVFKPKKLKPKEDVD